MSCKKTIIFSLIFTLLLSAFFSPVFAATTATPTTESNQFLKIQNAAKQGKTTLERWSEDQITATSMTMFRALIGEIPEAFFTQLKDFLTTGKGNLPKLAIGGAIGSGTQMIATLFNPPASGIEYIASTWEEGVLGKPAYAQGFGFKGLQFLLPLWKAARNMVYVLSSIIFVVIGFMIILRVKVSPQAVVTIQSAIPQVITTLILVTFSYAIAGLMIDLGNIILGIVMSVIFNTQGVGLNDNIVNSAQFGASSGFPLISDILQAIQGGIDSLLKPFNFVHLVNPDMDTLKLLSFMAAPHWWSLMLLGGMVGSTMTGIFLGSVGNIIGGAGDSIFTWIGNGVGGLFGGFLGAVLMPIIFSIIVGIWLIKLYFGLIKVYVTIIFKIISGPLEIAMGAFPNSKVGFSSWLLDLFANIMVFPIVTIFLVIINLITNAMFSGLTNGVSGDRIWAPGLIWSSNTLYTPILGAAVGMAGLALISKLPDLIPQYIFMIKPSPFGQAIGQNLESSSKFMASRVGDLTTPNTPIGLGIDSVTMGQGSTIITNMLKGK